MLIVSPFVYVRMVSYRRLGAPASDWGNNSSIPGSRNYFLKLRNSVIMELMKPQDVIILIKLHIWDLGRWKIVPLAESVFISKTEVQKAIQRLKAAALSGAQF